MVSRSSGRGWLVPTLALSLLLPWSVAGASTWSQVTTPTPGPTRAIGGVANGCIGGAAALPAQGPGYVSVRRERNRYYGHPDLVALIETLGREIARWPEQPGLLMVGDLSQPRGGLMSTLHRSHQNGLDVDLWFSFAADAAQAARLTGAGNPPSMVSADGRRANAHWGAAQQRLMEAAARHPRVERLFVHAAIKRALCDRVGGDRAWLRKVRPWRGHDAHVHVRLHCPGDSPSCEVQAPIPAGDGCGSDLDWWFTAEARQPLPRAGGEEPAPPVACLDLLFE